jgi:hypothetical protein
LILLDVPTEKNICLILSTFTVCFPVSGCAGMSLSALLCPWAYDAVKTALHDIAEKLLIWSNTILTRSLDIGF